MRRSVFALILIAVVLLLPTSAEAKRPPPPPPTLEVYQLSATLYGTYTDLLGSHSFSISIDCQRVESSSTTSYVMRGPSVQLGNLPSSYRGQASIYKPRGNRAYKTTVPDYFYTTFSEDFGGFIYPLNWPLADSNALNTADPLSSLQVGEATTLAGFDIFVTNRKVWNGETTDYDLGLHLGDSSGTATRIGETVWSIDFSSSSSTSRLQRYPYLNYPIVTLDWQNYVRLEPAVTYSGTATLVRIS